MARCAHCGQQTHGAFCGACGRPVTPEDSVQDLYWSDAPEDTDQSGDQPDPVYPVTPGPQDSPQPPPRRSPNPGLVLLVALAAVMVVVVAGILAWNYLAGDESPASGPEEGTAQGPENPGPEIQTSTPTDPATMTAAEAGTKLRSLRGESLDTSLDGRWVLQLSSKYDGVSDPSQTALDGGHVFHLPDILNDHQNLREQMGARGVPVLLLYASDFGRSTSPHADRTWVTIADPGGMTSQDAAQSRCYEFFPGLSGQALNNVCLPRQLRSPY